VRIAQTILDRVLFIAFAEDKGLLTKGTSKTRTQQRTITALSPRGELQGLFNAIDKGNPVSNPWL